MKRIRPIALVGVILLLGLAATPATSTPMTTTHVTTTTGPMLLYLALGGLTPPLVGAPALAAVAVSLLYGERQLCGSDGFSG